MSQQFVNREKELEFLKRTYSGRNSSMVIIYGRRRVGKSELVLQFSKNKKGLYFLCSTEGDRENIRALQNKFAALLGDDSFAEIRFERWHNLFSSLVNHKEFAKVTKKKFVLILDEFPYMITANPHIPSVFQIIWEELLSKENILLILTGSSISIMERKVLSSKSPLYGRRQGSFSLDPLDFIYLRDFLPDYGIEDLIRVWLVVGGIPEYLLKFNPQVSFWSNVEERVLKKGSYLYEEAEILLRDEFKEPRNYKLILKAISFGHQTAGKICNFTGLDKSMVSKYLDVLKEVKIVTDFIPVTESRRFKGRIYNIIDPYFNFWFRFVYPNKTDLEAHQERDVLERIKEEFSEYGGRMFEHLIEGLIRKKFLLNQVAFTKLGKQWGKIPRAEKGKNTYEIDICAINDRTKDILFGECKWKSQVNARSILSELKEKARHVHWHNDKRKEYYVLFAKSFKEKINEKNVYLFDLSDIGRLF